MLRKETNGFSYDFYEPKDVKKDISIVLFHGWGSTVESQKELATRLTKHGYSVIVPEIIYHDDRQPLGNYLSKEIKYAYFWKTVMVSIDEASAFYKLLNIPTENLVLMGISMGGFIVNGTIAAHDQFAGLVNINGSGSFVLSEQLFRVMDDQPEMTDKEKQLLENYDPIKKGRLKAPILMLHGTQDTQVSIEGQKNYYTYLTEQLRKTNVFFNEYSDINHTISDEMIEDLIQWLNQLTLS
ncbi:alpha/beta hydrolase family protein [Terrilactibacillus laevilacticus]|uniref:Alpha/beta hydrolase family protein n=1 Tax=Terrilactibacillus laevilacticus TaxID=1380157 RepID=A0ABW5PQS2_9BACI|nr:alpha/beta fold hydrolase [Terrilactibacillus laevilacticus]